MLVKPGEEFNVERVIEKALRQDVGPDPTLAMNKQGYKYVDEKNPAFPIWEYKKKYRDNDPVLSAEGYFYDFNQIDRRQRQFDFDRNALTLNSCRGEASDFHQQTSIEGAAPTQIHAKDQQGRRQLARHGLPD